MEQDINKKPSWDIEIDYLSHVGFALQQSSVPFVRHIAIFNNTDLPCSKLSLEISSSPEFIISKVIEIDRLDGNNSWRSRNCEIKLNFDYFSTLSEKVTGSLNFKLYKTRDDGTFDILCEKSFDVFALPANAWAGLSFMPQFLAAFVTPNLGVIAKIQQQMAALLAESGVSDALSGYQEGKQHIREILQSAYNILAQQKIAYAVAPASFNGQRIRFAPEIFHEKLANCLDFSLLFASIFEQCGLHPLILLTDNHAFVGCHAIDTSLSDAFSEDIQAVKKRVQLDEIFLFETTCALGSQPSSFKYAEEKAIKHLEESNFEGVLDIYQSRKEKFMPLPLKTNGNEVSIDEKYSFKNTGNSFDERVRTERTIIEVEKHTEDLLPHDRLSRWQSKLLDLSKNNKLLNFKENGKVLPIVLYDIAKWEDYANTGNSFSIHPTTEMISGTDLRNYAALGKSIQGDPVAAYLQEELACYRIHSTYDKSKLNSKLLAIYRQAKTDLEEGGCNTLHMALGFLEWCEQGSINNRHYRAPILLVPMKLERKSAAEGFSLKRSDEEVVINATLLEMLSHDFEMNIPGINPNNLPQDDSGVDVEKILLLFQTAIKDISGWEVKKEAYLGCFSFQKILMYNDLHNRTDELLKHPLVDHLLNHPTEQYDDKYELVYPHEIDKQLKTNSVFCPLSADSSQLSAVISAERGKSFVLYGPPGTGKSQTITNIIAHCLANKKKVLFVSEKKAALEVVYRRLQDVGLGPFCLELHSNKSGKNEVMRQFRDALDYNAEVDACDWEKVSAEIDKLREHLSSYVEAIHKKYPNNFTPYQAFSFLIAYADKVGNIPSLEFQVSDLSDEIIAELKNCASNIDLDSAKFTAEQMHILDCIKKDVWTPAWRDDVQTSSQETTVKAKTFLDNLSCFCSMLNYSDCEYSMEIVALLLELCKATINAPMLPSGFYDDDWQSVTPLLSQLKSSIEKRNDLMKKFHALGLKSLISSGMMDLSDNQQLASHYFSYCRTFPVLNSTETDTAWHKELLLLLHKQRDIVSDFYSSVRLICKEMGCQCDAFNDFTVANLSNLWQLVMSSPNIPKTLFTPDWEEVTAQALSINDIGKRFKKTQKLLSNFDLTKVKNSNAETLKKRLLAVKDGANILQKVRRFFILKKIQACVNNSSFEITSENAEGTLDLFVEYTQAYKAIRSVPISIAQNLDDLWNYEDSDWELMHKVLEHCKLLNQAIEKLVADNAQEAVRSKVCDLIACQNNENHSSVKAAYRNFSKVYSEHKELLNKIIDLIKDNWYTANASGTLSDIYSAVLPDEINSDQGYEIDYCDFSTTLSEFVIISAQINKILSTANISSRLGFLWKSGQLNSTALQHCLNYIEEIEKIISISWDKERPDLRSLLGRTLSDAESHKNFVEQCSKNIKCWKDYYECAERNLKTLSVDLQPANVIAVDKLNRFIMDDIENLRYLCKWNSTKAKAEKFKLGAFVKMAGHSNTCSIALAVEFAIFHKFAYEICESSSVLSSFLGSTQNEQINKFQQLDDLYTRLSSKKVCALIASEMPSKYARLTSTTDTGLGSLRREVQRQTRIMPVRKLLENFSSIALRLKPCMLMSPLSVAQYLPPDRTDFDLVIFDEASQITPWDAIGAIARGKQLIVVGDPQQLPPTNFFQRQDSEDDIVLENDTPDEKSILDECILANMSTMHLKWHYRSRHEDLIAFSNHHYYENKLLTFPAAQNNMPPLGINFKFVSEGVYANRSNKIEAQKLVDYVVDTLKSPYFMDALFSKKEKSLGIITFNQTQQELIEDMLDLARRENPEIEPFFSNDYFEPVFVKNIENVQGDERDFIFFSICFGKPEQSNRISMNFGPLNKEGGQRRLNVAVTRAKESIFVFSSIHHDDIDLSRTNKTGPRHLKYFLEYAEKGSGILGSEISSAYTNNYESLFEQEVAEFLRNNGYEVHSQVGTSGYRIDLAIVSQHTAGRYILGIECDGASYHSAASVRDRDKLRQRVLEGLGWKFARVWSTDWWNSPVDTKRKLLECVEKAIADDKSTDFSTSSQNTIIDEMFQDELTFESNFDVKEQDYKCEDCVCACEFAEKYSSLDYLQTDDLFKDLYSEDFYETYSAKIIKEQIQVILTKEAPIVESLLQKRIVQAWGFQRTGERISNILEQLMPNSYTLGDFGEKVYWLNKADAKSYNKFRPVASEQESIRKLEEIPLEELKNAMVFINEEYQTFYGEEALFKETAKLFGFTRLTSQAQKRYQAALNKLKKSKIKVNIIH